MPVLSTLRSSECEGDYRAPRKYVLVLSCVDARLLDDLLHFLDQDNLTNRYYHVTLPGTALGLTDHVENDTDVDELLDQFRRWRQTFIDQVQAAVILTEGKISDIYVVQHEDCGAFRVYLGKDAADMTADEELDLHQGYAAALLEDLCNNFDAVYNPVDGEGHPVQKTGPAVHAFYMDLRGHVEHLESCSKAAKGKKGKGRGKKGKG